MEVPVWTGAPMGHQLCLLGASLGCLSGPLHHVPSKSSRRMRRRPLPTCREAVQGWALGVGVGLARLPASLPALDPQGQVLPCPGADR